MPIEWDEIFPDISDATLAKGTRHFTKTLGKLAEADWQQQGTLLCLGTGRSRVGFAIRTCWCSWHFRDRRAIIEYRQAGGQCPSTAVTIKFKHDDQPDYGLLRKVIRKTLAGQ